MQKKYIFLTFLLMAMIFIVAFVAERNNCDSSISEQFHFKSKKCTAMSPAKLLVTALSTDRFLGVDDLAEKIISEDPTYILIDIRRKNGFNHRPYHPKYPYLYFWDNRKLVRIQNKNQNSNYNNKH